jgi:uncharacterized protein (TIGR00255 family)
MIKSMTGFGRGEFNAESGQFIVEIRSVNSRSCNILIKLPENLLSLESQVCSYVGSRISRGQINVSVTFNKDGTEPEKRVILDRELVKEYIEQLESLRDTFLLSDPVFLNTIATLPGVISIREPKEDASKVWGSLLKALEIAVEQLIETRRSEGDAISSDLSIRLKNMLSVIEHIKTRSPEVIEEYRQRLKERITELLQEEFSIDETRIAMELAIMAKRSDITEEIVRLRSHISQIEKILQNSKDPVGRHLDFILQEINREVNTIASKTNDVQIATQCIRLKDETDKMREQAQNIE